MGHLATMSVSNIYDVNISSGQIQAFVLPVVPTDPSQMVDGGVDVVLSL